MAILDKYELTKVVSVSNDILTSEYYVQPELELTLQQKQLLTYMISRIDKGDTGFRLETIQIREYCDLFGINYDGSNKKKIRESVLALGKKCFILPVAPGREKLFRWIDDAEIDYKEGVLYIKLAESLRPYYLNLTEKFAPYQLGYTVSFRSKYSYVLYEFLKSNEFKQFFYYDVEKAKKEWAYEKYKNFADFKRFVLDPAISEINEFTDINVKYEAEKVGKTYTNLHFFIEKKRGEALARVDSWKVIETKKHQNKETLRNFFSEEMREAAMDDGSKEKELQEEYDAAIDKMMSEAENLY